MSLINRFASISVALLADAVTYLFLLLDSPIEAEMLCHLDVPLDQCARIQARLYGPGVLGGDDLPDLVECGLPRNGLN